METIKIIDAEGKTNAEMPTFYANPERAIAKLKEDRNLVLPVISISISDIDDDPDRRRTNMTLNLDTTWDKTEQRSKRIVSIAPKAVKLSYLVNIWSKYVEDLNQIVENIQLMFNPSLDIRTNFSSNIQAFITQVADNSSAVVGDRQDRVLRKTVQITADAYIPTRKYLYSSTGQLEVINMEIEFLDTSGSAIETISQSPNS